MPVAAAPELLVLHAVRLSGMADERQVARRFRLDPEAAAELLLDFEAHGWIARTDFHDTGGWALTESGRRENERLLAAELDAVGAREQVTGAHAEFLPLNARFLAAITRWQVRPTPGDPLAANDHTDFRWDDQVLDELGRVVQRATAVCDTLTTALARFDGYASRLTGAVARANRGEHSWIDQLGVDSCHTVWFELHEDLIATLGIRRGEVD